jgi:hypothetical protein
VVQGGPKAARPGDRILVIDVQQQPELLVVELVVIVEVGTKEWERLDERSSSGQKLRPPPAQLVESGELLVQPNGIFGAEHGHRRAQRDPVRDAGGGGEHHARVGDGVVLQVMLAEAVEGEADLFRQPDPLQRVGQAVGYRDARPGGRVGVTVPKAVDAELHGWGQRSYPVLHARPGSDAEPGRTQTCSWWSGPTAGAGCSSAVSSWGPASEHLCAYASPRRSSAQKSHF